MQLNILQLVKNYLNKETVTTLAGSLGEKPLNIQNALETIVPLLMAGVIKKASTTTGAIQVMGLLNENDEVSVFEKLSGLRTNLEQYTSLTAAGAKMMPTILGGESEQATNIIATQSGISRSSVSNLLVVAAPVLISVVGKVFKTSGMGVSGLASLLMGQQERVAAALPAGLRSLMKLADPADFKEDQGPGASSLPQPQKSGISSLIPWALAALLLLATIFGIKSCMKSDAQVTTTVVDSIGISADKELDSNSGAVVKTGQVTTAIGDFQKKQLPGGAELNIPAFGVENKLIDFVEDSLKSVDKTSWFNFDRINFESGSAMLSSESLEQIENIASILKAFPKVSVKLGGYTDNTGDPAMNLRLSQERAEAVKTAIVSQGINTRRLEAEGYGKEHPVASNDTYEGRTQNRRIAILVTAK